MKHEPMGLAYYLGHTFFRLLFSTWFRWRVFHAERVPRQGSLILAANHSSYLDPPLVGAGLPRRVIMMARDTLFRFPLFGPLLRSWHAVPVDPKGGSAAGLKAILDRLIHEEAVLIFPEGTRSGDGQFLPARSGVGLVVIKSSAPLVPVRVWGTHEAYGRNRSIPRPGRVMVKYGFPMTFEREREEARHCSKGRLKELYQEIADEIMRQIAALQPCREHDRFPPER